MQPIDALAAEIRKVNTANGWNPIEIDDWEKSPHRIPASIALIHSEISEAWEAWINKGVDETLVELADVLIRVLDLAGGITHVFNTYVLMVREPARYWTEPEEFASIHLQASRALEAFRRNEQPQFLHELAKVYRMVVRLATSDTIWPPEFGGEFIADVVRPKIDKNRKRGFRHGGKKV